MGSPCGRVGDLGIGTCAAHDSPKSIVTIMNTGAPTTKVNGRLCATAISIGLSSCGHATVVLSYSATVKANGANIHRVGDTGALPIGGYVLSTGSPNVKVGG